MPIYTVTPTVEVAADSPEEACGIVIAALKASKQAEIVAIHYEVTDEREDDEETR